MNLTERPTPETDAQVKQCCDGLVGQDSARRLERERDEAREQVVELRNSIRAAETLSKVAWERHTEKCVELATAREQRDRLREELDQVCTQLEALCDAYAVDTMTERKQLVARKAAKTAREILNQTKGGDAPCQSDQQTSPLTPEVGNAEQRSDPAESATASFVICEVTEKMTPEERAREAAEKLCQLQEKYGYFARGECDHIILSALNAQREEDGIDTIVAERDMWKAHYDNQVTLRRILMDRPDLGDRAKRMTELIAENDRLQATVEKLREAIKGQFGVPWTNYYKLKVILEETK